MLTVGVVAEYNPFHNGHKHHLELAKSELNADFSVVVMSGNYVQRGEPAIIHKWKRAEMCLLGGADLVIELPVYYSTASAEYFASAAVKILNSANIIDYICFGAECKSLKQFSETAGILLNEPDEYKTALKASLSEGNSYPAARAKALSIFSGDKFYETPNNILGIEYMKALLKASSKIVPHIIERTTAMHDSDELGDTFSSASAIRKAVLSGSTDDIRQSVPTHSYNIMKNSSDQFPIFFDKYSDMLIYKIKSLSESELLSIFDVSEGIQNRIVSASHFDSVSNIVSHIKTKRYTFTKIQRILLHILLGIEKKHFSDFELLGGPQYIRVLGFRKSAYPLVKKLTQSSKLPVILNLKKDMQKLSPPAVKMLKKEIESSDTYFIKCDNQSLRRKNIEYYFPLITVK